MSFSVNFFGFCAGLKEGRERFGHFGLGLSHYTHFTSPIRRYADIVVHRLLLASLGVSSTTAVCMYVCMCIVGGVYVGGGGVFGAPPDFSLVSVRYKFTWNFCRLLVVDGPGHELFNDGVFPPSANLTQWPSLALSTTVPTYVSLVDR